MPRANNTVRVRETDPFCFLVESWSSPKYPQRVELLANDGFGECSCWNWIKEKWPAIRDKKTQFRGTDLTECRHVKAARKYKWNAEMKRLSAQ